MIKKIDHLVITTCNMKKCIAFYEILGFEARHNGGRWELFSGDFKINVHYLGNELSPRAGCIQPGSADLCFELAVSLKECCRHLEEQGLKLELGPVARSGTGGKMTSVYLRDPDQNLIELCTYA